MADLPADVEPEDDDTEEGEGPVVDETANAADPASVQRAQDKKKFKEDQKADFWRRVLADPVGQVVVWDLLESCGTRHPEIAASPAGFPDERGTWLAEGKRSIGVGLREMLMRVDFDGVKRMYDQCHPDFYKPKPKRRKVQN